MKTEVVNVWLGNERKNRLVEDDLLGLCSEFTRVIIDYYEGAPWGIPEIRHLIRNNQLHIFVSDISDYHVLA